MKLDKYVVYMGIENGQRIYGSVNACFDHSPPTYADIKDVTEQIKNQFNLDSCLILGWQDIAPVDNE